jgi:enediyne biosynthesis protein E5
MAGHHNAATAVSGIAAITGSMCQLYIIFTITDPKTTVRSFRGQCLVAFLVVLVETIFRLLQLVHAPYYALFVVAPATKLVEIALRARKRLIPAAASVS